MKNRVALRQVEAFVAVARERSFTRAAAALGVSQSALTLQIRGLEEALGLTLFDRTTRSVSPTAIAAAFLPTAERLLGGFEQFVGDLTAHADKERGSVVIAAAASFIALVLAPAVTRLAHRYPNIELRLIEEGTEQVTRRLLAGEADLGITSLTQPARGLDSALLLRDTFGVLGRRDSPVMQGEGPIRLSALADERLVAIGRENGIRAQLDRHRGTAALMARARCEISSVAGVQHLVEQGAGIALLPSLTARQAVTSGLQFRPLAPAIGRELHVLRRPGRELSPAARELAHVMQEQLVTLDVPGVRLAASADLRRFLR